MAGSADNPCGVRRSFRRQDSLWTSRRPHWKDALELALSSRPSLQKVISVWLSQDRHQVLQRQSKPQVDAYATVTASGLAERSRQRFNSGTSLSAKCGGVDRIQPAVAFKHVARDFPTVKAGIQISLPFSNRTARENVTISLLEGKRLQMAKKQMERYVTADVSQRSGAAECIACPVRSRRIAARAAREQYASEQRQFQEGTSTVFLVLQRQTSLISARSNEVRARADLAEAIANVNRATARTLEANQIKMKLQ